MAKHILLPFLRVSEGSEIVEYGCRSDESLTDKDRVFLAEFSFAHENSHVTFPRRETRAALDRSHFLSLVVLGLLHCSLWIIIVGITFLIHGTLSLD